MRSRRLRIFVWLQSLEEDAMAHWPGVSRSMPRPLAVVLPLHAIKVHAACIAIGCAHLLAAFTTRLDALSFYSSATCSFRVELGSAVPVDLSEPRVEHLRRVALLTSLMGLKIVECRWMMQRVVAGMVRSSGASVGEVGM